MTNLLRQAVHARAPRGNPCATTLLRIRAAAPRRDARMRTSAPAAASRYAARRRSFESRTIAHLHFIVGRNRFPATHHARLSERYRNDRQDADAAASPLRHRAVRAVPEARIREPRRLDQGPHWLVDDRGGREARRA